MVPVPEQGRRTLGRAQRLTRPSQFTQVFDQGTKSVGRFMVMWIRTVPTPGHQVGVVASKRSIGKAVQRNLAKRRLREAFRTNQEKIASGHELVLIARRSILDAEGDAVNQDFCRTAGEAGVLVEQHEEE